IDSGSSLSTPARVFEQPLPAVMEILQRDKSETSYPRKMPLQQASSFCSLQNGVVIYQNVQTSTCDTMASAPVTLPLVRTSTGFDTQPVASLCAKERTGVVPPT
ncbi:hypothetical protein HAX54_041289, partial [Datura stramonium]|nr:hypothetical protein [Datura stramonium]